MRLWNRLAGWIETELTSAQLEAVLTAINASGIAIMDLQRMDELTCTFWIRRKQFRALQALAEKRGESLNIIRRTGLVWAVRTLRRRPVLVSGCLVLALLVGYLPTRVFFVQVSGNSTVPIKQILAAAEACGIGFGASRREVRSEKVKNELLAQVPQLQWAGVNTSGCTAVISVRERAMEEADIKTALVSSIVADRDGYILSGTTVQGNALFQPGQAVKEGQVLISGYTDCGLCIRASRAEGEVFALTSRTLEAVMPSESIHRGAAKAQRKKISILFGKKRINLWEDSGILDSTCGRIYKEYYITLPGGFVLPAALCIDTYTAYACLPNVLPEEQAQEQLRLFAERYLVQQMVAGEIRSRTQVISEAEGAYRLHGSYLCTEMIGREQREQIGETNGKNNGTIR